MNKEISIGVLSASNSLVRLSRRIAEERDLDFTGANLGLDEAIPRAKELEAEGIEVLLARGGTAPLIRDNVLVPVLSFPVTAMDVISCLKKAASLGKKILLVSFRKKLKDIEIVQDLLNIRLIQQVCYHIDDLVELILESRGNYDVVVGGATTVRVAIKYGFKAVETITSDDVVYSTIDNAISVARSAREEQAKTQRYYHIIDAVSDGVVAMDRNGKIITVNKSAKSFLNVKEDDLDGLTIDHLLPNSSILDALKDAQPFHDKIEKLKNRHFVFNHIPIRIKKETVGSVSTFNDVSNVVRVENEMRQSLAKGFVARYTFKDFLYKSPVMRGAIQRAKNFAKTNSTILIYGETGTGKEILAHSIHNHSSRRKKPFVSINCAALNEQLLESELFGYEEGAFTGSKKGGKAGLFEIGHKGSIFLDEIPATSSRVQMQLLRVLQEKEVMRIGADRIIPVDVRVIAASNKDLGIEVADNRFREDLYFRLNVLSISLPPLRDRLDDIPLLLNSFIQSMSLEHDRKPIQFPKTTINRLREYYWPGNVRQLSNFAERIFFLCKSAFDDQVFEELYNELIQYPYEKEVRREEESQSKNPNEHIVFKKVDHDEELIRKVLAETKFNRRKTAEILGISRTTLWKKMKALDL